mmetsp:Transcript_15870/g.47621  ORF Transcript_15870/g.47621 Transcript_15870/m.47621 type:complete len:824 (-) Transcript_15870:159-2630(-)
MQQKGGGRLTGLLLSYSLSNVSTNGPGGCEVSVGRPPRGLDSRWGSPPEGTCTRRAPSLIADVVEGRDLLQFPLDSVGHVQPVHEPVDPLLVHGLVRPREILQHLVGARVALSAQDALQRLRDHDPVLLQVGVDGRLVHQQLAQAALDGRQRDEGVPEGHADVPQDRGVREVALEPADGKLLGEVLENRVGDAQVALGVLEVDGVHLVGHGAGADLAGDDLLLEVLRHDVHPDVAAEIEQDRVDALHRVEDGAHVVVVLDLRGVLLALEAQTRLAELVREALPVDVGVGDQVRVHVAGGAAELAAVRHLAEEDQLPLEALDEHLGLLGQVGRGGRLAVRPGEHGHVPLRQLGGQGRDDLVQRREEARLERVLDHQGGRRVVDVLARQREVHKLLEGLEAERVELLLDEVLDGLDVVVGDLLRGLDLLRLLEREVLGDGPELVRDARRQVLAGRQHLHEREEVLDLDVDAVPDQTELREEARELLGAAAVAAVDGRDGSELGQGDIGGLRQPGAAGVAEGACGGGRAALLGRQGLAGGGVEQRGVGVHAGGRAGREVVVEAHEVTLEHGHCHGTHLRDEGDAGPRREQLGLVDVLVAGHVHHGGALLDPGRVQLVLVRGDAQDHDVGAAHVRLQALALQHGRQLAALEEEGGVEVHAVDPGAVVRQHRGERPADDLGAVHDDGGLALQLAAGGQLLVVDVQVVQDLDHSQGRAGQHALRRGTVHEALVAVHGAAVEVAEPLHVLAEGDLVPEDVVLRGPVEARPRAEDGVVDHDAVHVRVLVRLLARRLEVLGVDLAHLEAEVVPGEGLGSPLRVLPRRRVLVG